MTDTNQIKQWFDNPWKENPTHMIVVCDSFDHEDYPAYVGLDEDVHERIAHYNAASMQTIMEVYKYNIDENQFVPGKRVWNV